MIHLIGCSSLEFANLMGQRDLATRYIDILQEVTQVTSILNPRDPWLLAPTVDTRYNRLYLRGH